MSSCLINPTKYRYQAPLIINYRADVVYLLIFILLLYHTTYIYFIICRYYLYIMHTAYISRHGTTGGPSPKSKCACYYNIYILVRYCFITCWWPQWGFIPTIIRVLKLKGNQNNGPISFRLYLPIIQSGGPLFFSKNEIPFSSAKKI